LGSWIECPQCGSKTYAPKDLAELSATKEVPKAKIKGNDFYPRLFRLLGPVRRVPVGVWVLLLVIAVVGWRYLDARPKLPKNFDQILDEICSVGEIYRVPVVNNASTLMWFARASSNGVGIYRTDIRTGERKQMFEVDELDYENRLFDLYGWSPQDGFLALVQKSTSKKSPQEIVLCHGETGELRQLLDAEGLVEEFTWVNERSFCYINDLRVMCLYEQLPSGLWQKTKEFPLTGAKARDTAQKRRAQRNRGQEAINLKAMFPIGPNQVAWHERGQIMTLDFKTGKSTQLTKFDGKPLEWLNYNKERGEYLFCKTMQRQPVMRYLFKFNPALPEGQQLQQVTNGEDHTFNGRFAKGGERMLWVRNWKDEATLCLRDVATGQSTNLFTGGHIRAFMVAPDTTNILCVASMANEPQGIWRYHLGTGELRVLEPGAPKPFVAAQIINPLKSAAETEKGGKVPFYLLPPRDLQRAKKYPVVIDGPNDARWKAIPQAIANAGIYYVSVNRRGLASSDDLRNAAQDILDVHRALLKIPNVDSNAIYLVGFSASTSVVTELYEKHPELWAGLILNNPSLVPSQFFTDVRLTKFLVSMGEKERSVDYVDRFATKAAQEGIPVIVNLHTSAGHVFKGSQLLRDRAELITGFVKDQIW
jgi:predicted esterase